MSKSNRQKPTTERPNGGQENPELAPLPPSAQMIADYIGREATMLLAIKAANRCIYIPKGPAPGHWIAYFIGQKRFAILQKEFAGMQITLANCTDAARAERDEEIRQGFRDGKSVAMLAIEFGLTTRRIKSILDERCRDYFRRKEREAKKL